VPFAVPARAAAQLRAVAAAEQVPLTAVGEVDAVDLVAAAAGGQLLQLACGWAPLSAMAGYGPPVVAALSRVLLRAAGARAEAVAEGGETSTCRLPAPSLTVAGQVDRLFEQVAEAGYDLGQVASRVAADLAGEELDDGGMAVRLASVVAAAASYLE
jgi:hypothetical protein